MSSVRTLVTAMNRDQSIAQETEPSNPGRSEREFRAALRHRNIRQLKIAAAVLSVAMPLFTLMDYLTIAERDGPAVRDWYVRLDIGLALFFWTLLLIAVFRKKLFKRFVAVLWVLGSMGLIGAQIFLLWKSGQQAPYILLVEILGVAAFVNFRRSFSILYLSCLTAAGSVLFFLKVYPFLQIVPPLLAIFVAGLVIIFLRDRLTRQSTEIAEKNRRLSVNNRRLQVARRETDRILRNVREALFILDKDFRMGSQSSAAAARILEVQDTSGLDFGEFMRGILDPRKYESAISFLRMMFQPARKENKLAQLNPLRRVVAQMNGEKHLAFRFHRIREDKRIVGLMTTVLDETELRLEQAALAEKEVESRRRSEILLDILRIPPELLRNFLRDAKADLTAVEALVSVEENREGITSAHREEVFRRIHTMKGNAQSLDLDAFADVAHEFEDLLASSGSGGASPEPGDVRDRLKSLRGLLDEIEEVLRRMAEFQESLNRDTPNLLVKSLTGLIERQARESGRRVELDAKDFAPEDLPSEFESLFRDVLVQLARNSIAHGIETPDRRHEAGKEPAGLVRIALEKNSEELVLVFRDDGAGLDPDKLKKRALERGLRSAAEINAMDDAAAMALIFESGLSTADENSRSAGRGVGMDLVRAKVREAGGVVRIASKRGSYCEFRIRLPLKYKKT